CSKGNDAAKLDTQERARLRKQALDWLNADVRAWQNVLKTQPTKADPVIANVLGHWLEDTDLSGVRAGKPLATLPLAERMGWQKLWHGVKEMRQKAVKLNVRGITAAAGNVPPYGIIIEHGSFPTSPPAAPR
ncbi:MAG TPA: hypothetical protein VFA18_25520, partial [Gemmataceae bacterium]|nr:hypothetical protein [Gemmataceae bacterium]